MSFARKNQSSRAKVSKETVFATGAFKKVYAGIYTEGTRQGEACVAKEFKSGSVYKRHYFQEEMNIIRLAQQMIDAWSAANCINSKILLSTPEIWAYGGSEELCLVEPFITGYEHFNSNTGWAPVSGSTWTDAMQALSHFSYHNSGGQFLLCDLQGGACTDGYILSDPVIMSQKQNCGPADLGPAGIDSFFHRHRCTLFCRSDWIKPELNGQPSIRMSKGTTMVNKTQYSQKKGILPSLQKWITTASQSDCYSQIFELA